MSDDNIYLTMRGLEKLRRELKQAEYELNEILARTQDAMDSGGDPNWHDNGAFEGIVNDTRGADWKLKELHKCLNKAKIVQPTQDTNCVAIGTRVKFLRDEKERVLEIVGYGESDPENGLVAYNTPIAQMLIGKKIGDTVIGTIAQKTTTVEILEISQGGKE